jgi:hypothetical protein
LEACLALPDREEIEIIAEARPADLRRFLADEETRQPSPSSPLAGLKGAIIDVVQAAAR